MANKNIIKPPEGTMTETYTRNPVKHSFMEIYPRGRDNKRAKLYVVHDSLEVNPDMDITVTELYRGKTGRVHKHFFNKGRGGISFKCSVIIDQKTKYGKINKVN